MTLSLLSLCIQLPLRERLLGPRTTGREELPCIGARAMGLTKQVQTQTHEPMSQIKHSAFECLGHFVTVIESLPTHSRMGNDEVIKEQAILCN